MVECMRHSVFIHFSFSPSPFFIFRQAKTSLYHYILQTCQDFGSVNLAAGWVGLRFVLHTSRFILQANIVMLFNSKVHFLEKYWDSVFECVVASCSRTVLEVLLCGHNGRTAWPANKLWTRPRIPRSPELLVKLKQRTKSWTIIRHVHVTVNKLTRTFNKLQCVQVATELLL